MQGLPRAREGRHETMRDLTKWLTSMQPVVGTPDRAGESAVGVGRGQRSCAERAEGGESNDGGGSHASSGRRGTLKEKERCNSVKQKEAREANAFERVCIEKKEPRPGGRAWRVLPRPYLQTFVGEGE